MNQFLAMAAAGEMASIPTAERFFAERAGPGDVNAAISFLTRAGGEPPRAEDTLPSD